MNFGNGGEDKEGSLGVKKHWVLGQSGERYFKILLSPL
jgi:hypothetical protein